MTWQIVVLLACLPAMAVVLIVRAIAPGRPTIQALMDDTEDHLAPTSNHPAVAPGTPDRYDRLAAWLGLRVSQRLRHHHVPGLLPRPADAALLGISITHHLGEKAIAALLGALLGPLTARLMGLSALSTFGAALTFAAAGYVLVGHRLTKRAQKVRADFADVASMYLEVVAMSRLSGASVTKCLTDAAGVGDHPEMVRIASVLDRARWSGTPPWEAMEAEADRLALPEMRAIADIARTGGSDDAEMYRSLRSRASAMRSSQLGRIRQAAKQASVLVSVPVSGLLLVFCAALAYPFLIGLQL